MTQIEVNITHSTAEVSEAALQTVDAFAGIFSGWSDNTLNIKQIDKLNFCLSIVHPLVNGDQKAIYSKFTAKTKSYLIKIDLDYFSWISLDWASRVRAVASALADGIAIIHKKRVTQAERAVVQKMIAEAEHQVILSAPNSLVPLKPVELIYIASSKDPIVNFGNSISVPTDAERTRALPPEEISEYLKNLGRPASEPEMFKLYRQSGEGFYYHEAWPVEGFVVEHWGVVGERGQTSQHAARTRADQINTLGALKRKIETLGFKPIPLSRQVEIVVQHPILGMGSPQNLNQLNALEAFLNDRTGWLGLGHCDGGSIGSGTMEVSCSVVDGGIARAVLERELRASEFKDFAIFVAQ